MRYLFTISFTILFVFCGISQTSVFVSAGDVSTALEHRYEGTNITYEPSITNSDLFSSISYTWKETIDGVTKNLGSGASILYQIPMIGTSTGKQVDVSVTISGIPMDTLIHPIDTTIHYILYVYKTPEVSQLSFDSVLFVGQKTTLSFLQEGGKSDAWTYQWSSGSTINAYEYVANQVGEHEITVLVKNELGNSDTQYDYLKTLTYHIKVLPACSVSHNQPQTAYRYANQTITYSPNISGGDATKWSYRWLVDGVQVSTDSFYTYTVSTGGGTLGKTANIQVELTNSPLNIKEDYTQTLSYSLSYYDRPEIESLVFDSVLFVGQKTTLSFLQEGGKSDAWTYQWSSGSTINAYEYVANQVGEHEITVLVKNKLGNSDTQYDYSKTLTYHIKVWPACEVEEEAKRHECFEQQTYTFEPKVKGGDSDNWKYKWSIDGDSVSNLASYTMDLIAIEETNDSIVYNVTLELINSPANIGTPFVKRIDYELIVWKRGSASIPKSKLYIYDEDSITIGVNRLGGDSKNWTFKWTKQGDTSILSTTETCKVVLENNISKIQTYIYIVEWQHAIGDNIGSSGKDSIILYVYPKVIAPSFGYDEVVQIRDIDTRTITLVKGSGGNPDGWNYMWAEGSYTTDSIYDLYEPIDSEGKITKTISIKMHWKNLSPNGETVWAEGDAIQDVIIYNTPKTPILKCKGNGISNIYIIDGMDMTEDELWNKEYYFRFWDDDDLKSELSNQRWYRYETTPMKAWAQSIWYYDDGFVCEGLPAFAQKTTQSASTKAIVQIYRISGEYIATINYDTENEQLDLSILGLDVGLYVLRYEMNGEIYIEKIMVK